MRIEKSNELRMSRQDRAKPLAVCRELRLLPRQAWRKRWAENRLHADGHC